MKFIEIPLQVELDDLQPYGYVVTFQPSRKYPEGRRHRIEEENTASATQFLLNTFWRAGVSTEVIASLFPSAAEGSEKSQGSLLDGTEVDSNYSIDNLVKKLQYVAEQLPGGCVVDVLWGPREA